MKRKKIILLTFIVVFLLTALLVVGSSVQAQEKEGGGIKFKPNITIPGSKFISGKEITITGSTIGEWIAAFYMFFAGAAAILATVMIMFGGYKYITSFGNPSHLQGAKDTIYQALIGLALTLGAYVILLTINPNLVKFKSLSLTPIEQILQGEAGEESEKGAPVGGWTGQNITTYDADFANVSGNNVDLRRLLKALMFVESGGNPKAISPKGACGLMQLLPSTASVPCDELVNNPSLSIEKAAQYVLRIQANTCPDEAKTKSGEVRQCKPKKTDCEKADDPDCLPKKTNCTQGGMIYVIAAYNGGVGANCGSLTCPSQTWWECESNKGFAETRDYVEKVQATIRTIQQNGW